MDAIFTWIKENGLPLVLLIMLIVHHVRVVRQKDRTIAAISIKKDAEIKRTNEARIAEQAAQAKQLMGVATEFTRLACEQKATLALLAERLPR